MAIPDFQSLMLPLLTLGSFPGSCGFGSPAKQSTETQVAASPDSMTPEDHIELGYQQIRGALAADLLRSIKDLRSISLNGLL